MLRIERIPHQDQRYDTCGDWMFDGDALVIRVSILPDSKYEILVALHELIEAVLCTRAGITQEQVDEFDMNYDGPGEPGDVPYCPYYQQHLFATRIERMLCDAMKLDWDKHEAQIEALEYVQRPA